MKLKLMSPVFIIASLLLMTGCQIQDEKVELKLTTQCAFTKKNSEGWIESVCTQKDLDGKVLASVYSGDNIDQKRIIGNEIPVVDDSGNIIERSVPTSPSYYYDASKRDESLLLSKFLENFRKDTLTLEDLKPLNLKNISSSVVVDLFNKAQSDSPDAGPYVFDHPYTNIEQFPIDNDSLFQIGYILDFGNIHDVNLKIINDKIDPDTMTKIESNFDNIEQQIIKNNNGTYDVSLLPNPDVLDIMNIEVINDRLNSFFPVSKDKKS